MSKKRVTYPQIATQLRDYALTYPESDEHFPWGELAIKVKGKVFLFLHSTNDVLGLSVKLPHSAELALTFDYTEPTGYGLGKSGWVSARFEKGAMPHLETLEAWIDESYRAVAPKKLVKMLATIDE
jgi:predicted DNA-binding protein (MmcQ/YjbR family)